MPYAFYLRIEDICQIYQLKKRITAVRGSAKIVRGHMDVHRILKSKRRVNRCQPDLIHQARFPCDDLILTKFLRNKSYIESLIFDNIWSSVIDRKIAIKLMNLKQNCLCPMEGYRGYQRACRKIESNYAPCQKDESKWISFTSSWRTLDDLS